MPQSKYCYPNSEVLINKFNIRDQEKLDQMEAFVTFNRLAELQVKAIKGNFDLKHLQKIHEYIFQDIYDFAGQLRTENFSKDSFPFASALYLENNAAELFTDLKRENHLSGMPVKEFSERAAHYMAEINVLHPFREGNGRTQREFIRTLALENGFNLDWSKVDKEKVFKASVLSKVNYNQLSEVIYNCITNKPPLKVKKKQDLKKKNEYELER